MTEKEKTTTSKFISLILRHDPSKAGITLDENGWADVSALLAGINKAGRTQINFDDLKDIVATCEKQRYSFNDDLTKIRANQWQTSYDNDICIDGFGWSIKVSGDYEKEMAGTNGQPEGFNEFIAEVECLLQKDFGNRYGTNVR